MSIAIFEPPETVKSNIVAERAKQIATYIQDISGVPTIGYKRGPAGVNICILSLNNGTLRIWPGAAQVHLIDSDKKKKQVVFSIEEKTRQIKVKHKSHVSGVSYKDDCWRNWQGVPIDMATFTNTWFNKTAGSRSLHDRLAGAMGLALPRKTKYSYEVLDRYVEQDHTRYGTIVHRLYDYIEITAKVPAMNMFVLAGYDEDDLFICELPKAVESLDEAYNSLMPKEVKLSPHHKRQGEWFFVPLSQEESSKLDDLLKEATPKGKVVSTREQNPFGWTMTKKPYSVALIGSRNKEFTCSFNSPLEIGSSHFATSLLTIKDTVYVSGAIIDTREGHHRPLFLSGWHKVYRNLEIVPNLEDMDSRRQRYWD